MNERLIKIRLFVVTAVAVTVLVCFMASCSQNHGIVERYAVGSGKGDEITRLNKQLFAAARMNVDPSDYLLGAGDLLQITVFESKNLDTTVRVSSRGFVTLPLLGQVQIKGLTAREVEIKIEDCNADAVGGDLRGRFATEEDVERLAVAMSATSIKEVRDRIPRQCCFIVHRDRHGRGPSRMTDRDDTSKDTKDLAALTPEDRYDR